ncbi:MAG: hypothetical protein IJ992_03810 [Lentisphaeria bacterium]|nr:hypothetical protein [Lentisphaeria bacterium]
MTKKILSVLTAALCMFSLAACCTTEDAACTDEAAPAAETPAVDPATVVLVELVDDEIFDALMGDQADPAISPVQAEMICKKDFQKYITIPKKNVFETDSNGVRYARVYGKMNELPFLEWLVTDDGPRPYRYRFLLTGKNGVKTFSPVETRLITPGDAVRFSVKVPADCTDAILLLDKAD